MGKTAESIEALVQYLDFASTDAEAWIELADLYLSQGLYSQAIYAQEEALVIAPNAWNVSWVNGDIYDVKSQMLMISFRCSFMLVLAKYF